VETTDDATRAAVLEHVAAFNAYDSMRLLAGLHRDIVWATGTDVLRGLPALAALFDAGLWELRPSLEVRSLVVEGAGAAAIFVETLSVAGVTQTFPIAAFFELSDGAIRSVKVFREGSADLEV
jgi:ketosteroid isomerase-like protein